MSKDRHHRRRTRFWVLMILSLLASALSTPLTPGTAHANMFWQCPFPAPYIPMVFPVGLSWTETRYSLVSATPTFDVSESKVVINATDSTITGTFTSQRSVTFTLQVTVGAAIPVRDFLTVNLSSTIVLSNTTATGVSASGPVPPGGRLIGEYGVEAFDVTYDLTTYRVRVVLPMVPACEVASVQRGSTNAPTSIEGWRLRTG